jgi:glyoxylase-like metal-dependent hydrolase (beta-lactamase superfamily II)
VLVQDGDDAILCAGDASYTEDLMLAGKVDGVSPDASMSRATLAAIREFAARQQTIYLPTHDPDSATRLAEKRFVAAL